MSSEAATRHASTRFVNAAAAPTQPPADAPRAAELATADSAQNDARGAPVSKRTLRHRRIRWHLFQVQLVAIVPIGVLAAVLLYLHWQAQEHERQQLQIESVRLLAAAVDNALDSTVERLSILGRLWGSGATDELGIYAQARVALERNGDWKNIVAVRADGTTAFQADQPLGTALSPNERFETWRPVIDESRPVVSDVFTSAQRGIVVSVGVPVVQHGHVTHVLIADLDPHWYDRLTTLQRPPDGAVSAVLDRNYKFVARSVDGDARRGGDPTPELVGELKRFRETLGRYTNLDGTAVYTAATHTNHGWSVGFATPSGPVDDAFRTHLLTFGLLWVAALLIGLAYAFAKARPIASSLEALEAQAGDIARGRRVSGAPNSGVAEVDAVIAALEQGSELLQGAMNDRLRALETERHARAEAEAANRAKDEFLSLLGHELRNPLAAISNATAIVRDPRHTPEDSAFGFEVIERQSRHLQHLIDDLLDVGRVMTDKIVLDRKPTDLATSARQVIAALQAAGRFADRHVELDAQSLLVEADPTRLEQILTNLLGNAARYTASGGHIRVRTRAQAGEGIVEISDDGRGIAADDLPKVFDPFFQGGATKDRVAGGLGVGLTLVDKLVRLHGGSVHVASAGPGRGATFTVRLPLSSAVAPVASSAVPPTAAMDEPLTVLLVEDNRDARKTLRMALEMRGCHVLEAGDGVEALDLVEHGRPVVALLDIGLPGMDGYELARRLRAKLGPAIVLIALTGYGTASEEEKSRRAGFDRHLTKPVGLGELIRVLIEATSGPRSSTPRTR